MTKSRDDEQARGEGAGEKMGARGKGARAKPRAAGPDGPAGRRSGRARERALAGKTPSDSRWRMRAAGSLGESFLVEAGAGTGKTALIMERLGNVICSRDIPMDAIVAITFTEKAAGELKSRLTEELEKRLTAAKGGTRARIENALREMDRAAISTIHSFCSSLLRERPVEAGVDPGFRVADEVQAEELLDGAWDQWLRERMVPENSRLRAAFALGATLWITRPLADSLARRRDMLDWIPRPRELPEPSAVLDGLRKEVSSIKMIMDRDLKDPEDKLAVEVEKVERFLDRCARLSTGEGAVGEGTARLPEQSWELLSSAIAGLKIRTGRVGSAAKWRSKESLESARELLRGIDHNLKECWDALHHNAVVGLAEELKIFVDLYERAKAEGGYLDYDDLLIGARNLLRDSREARDYFKSKFKVILIDEFQDTDPLQAEVAFYLAERIDRHSDSWEDVELDRGKLFLVGDPKQSIYRFRGADIEVYERSKGSLERSGETLQISVNFRSTPGVVDPVNMAFRDVMRRPKDGRYQPDYIPLDAFREGGGPGLVVLTPAGEVPDGLRADEIRSNEASAIAWSVREVVERAKWSILDKRTAEERPVSYGDIAVLFRATTGLGIYEEALRSWDIPYRVAGGKAFYTRAEVRALVSVLTAIENPHDAVAMVGALRSPFFGLSDEDIFLQRLRAGSLDFTETEGEGDVERAFSALRCLRESRNRLDLGSFLSLLFEKTGVLPALYMRPHGEQRVANLVKISAMASNLEATGPVTFKRFLRWVAGKGQRGVEEGESPVQEAGDDFVTVLTIHKAKGLEFPVVFLPGLWSKGKSGSESVVADRERRDLQIGLSKRLGLMTDGWEAASKREEAILRAEDMRLLYVAMTRARDKLVLPHMCGSGGDAGSGGTGGRPNAQSEVSAGSNATGVHLTYVKPVIDAALSGGVRWAEALGVPAEALERRREPALRVARMGAARGEEDYGALMQHWRESLEGVLATRAVREPIVSPTGLVAPLEAAALTGDEGAGEGGERGQEREGGAAERERESATGPRGGWRGTAEGEAECARDVGRRVGTLVHSVLEMESEWDADRMSALALSLGRELGLAPDAIERAVGLLCAFSRSSFAERVRASRRVRREVPFCVTLPEGTHGRTGAEGGDAPGAAMVEGAADLLVEENDGWVIVDFKTDAVGPEEVAARADHYRPQGACYALCLSRVLKRPIIQVIFYFLSPGMAHAFDVDEAMLEEARLAVAGAVS